MSWRFPYAVLSFVTRGFPYAVLSFGTTGLVNLTDRHLLSLAGCDWVAGSLLWPWLCLLGLDGKGFNLTVLEMAHLERCGSAGEVGLAGPALRQLARQHEQYSWALLLKIARIVQATPGITDIDPTFFEDLETVLNTASAGKAKLEIPSSCSFTLNLNFFLYLPLLRENDWLFQALLGFGALVHHGLVNEMIGVPMGTALLLQRYGLTVGQVSHASTLGHMTFLGLARAHLVEPSSEALLPNTIRVAILGLHVGSAEDSAALIHHAARVPTGPRALSNCRVEFQYYGLTYPKDLVPPMNRQGYLLGELIQEIVFLNRRSEQHTVDENMPALLEQLKKALKDLELHGEDIDLAHCTFDTPGVVCLALSEAFRLRAFWWFIHAIDMVPSNQKPGVCSTLEGLIASPGVALTAELSDALRLQADIGLVVQVVPRAYLHIKDVYSGVASKRVLFVRNEGWSIWPGGIVFKSVLEMYIQLSREVTEFAISLESLDQNEGIWLKSRGQVAAEYRAAVFVPDELAKMAAREYYAMGVPLLFGSQHMIVQIAVSTCQFFIFDSRHELGQRCGSQDKSMFPFTPYPLAPFPLNRQAGHKDDASPDISALYFWTSMLDLYHMPGVQVFDSYAGLLNILAHADMLKISEAERRHTKTVQGDTIEKATGMLSKILSEAMHRTTELD